MTYLGSDRFVVRELEGYASVTYNSTTREGLCVSVIDRAYCCAVMRQWNTEELGKRPVWLKRVEIRADAAAYAAKLNARTGASTQ